jgi:hypothetical protein
MSKTPSFESQLERKLPKFHNGRRFDPVSESVEFNLSGNEGYQENSLMDDKSDGSSSSRHQY